MFAVRGFGSHCALALNDQLYPLVVQCTVEMLMCMAYTTSREEKAMLRVFMRLQVNKIGSEMPIYTTYAIKCVRLTLLY